MTVFSLPDLGEGLQEAEIVTWHVSEGDHVIADQPLVSVETDKAVVEIPAPYSGTITRLIAAERDVIQIGAQLVDIETGKMDDTGAIVGQLDQRTEPARPAAPRPDRPASGRATPGVRHLAKEKGVNLADVTGTGPGGVILTGDVEAAASDAPGEELHGVRRVMARAMAASHAHVVPATVMERADVTAWADNEKPTERLIRAIISACHKEPALNAWFDGHRRQLHSHVDLALAVDTPDGLFTPVLRNLRPETDIAQEIEKSKTAVRDRSIAAEEMKNATITLSNFGMVTGEFATLVVSQPQVAILGAGRISPMYLPVDGGPTVCQVLPLSLTFDHRVVTGGEAARFLAAICADLLRPTAENGDEL